MLKDNIECRVVKIFPKLKSKKMVKEECLL